MPGTNAGTGYPLTLRCAKCKRGRDYRRLSEMCVGTNLEATGRTRPKPQGRGAYRSASQFVQYRCRDCGHVGWSTHSDAERLLRRRR